MHGDYRPGSGRYRPVDCCRLNIETARIHIGEGNCCAGCCDTSGSRNASVCGGDHFIAWPDSSGSKGKVDSLGSRPYPYHVPTTKIGRELAFEDCKFLAKYEPTPSKHATDGLIYFLTDVLILPRQVTKRNSHLHAPSG